MSKIILHNVVISDRVNLVFTEKIGVDVAEQSKILLSDKELVRQNILIFIAQVPSLLRYDGSSVHIVLCFLCLFEKTKCGYSFSFIF